MSEELKACPFCGANDPYHEISEDEIHVWIACGNCFATSSRVHTEHHTSADFAWNTRPLEDALRKQLTKAITEKDKWIKIYETESKLRRKDLIESDALRKQLEEEHTAALKITEQWIAKSKQLEVAVEALEKFRPSWAVSFGLLNVASDALEKINRIDTESGVNRTIDDEDGTELVE
jgi:hypothetical protein